jgi:hypothetical protein
VIVRPWVEFKSSLPDDQIEQGDTVVQYGGKAVAFIVADMLRRLGCEVQDPQHAYEHGWDWNVERAGRRYFCQVTDMGEFLLLIRNTRWLERVLKRTPQDYIDLLRGLQKELEMEPRFSEFTWYTQDELDHGAAGGRVPVEAGKERKRRRTGA